MGFYEEMMRLRAGEVQEHRSPGMAIFLTVLLAMMLFGILYGDLGWEFLLMAFVSTGWTVVEWRKFFLGKRRRLPD